jgi:hypothetical protein
VKQKRKILWILIGVGVIAGIFSIALLISCVGPPGPQGPPGPLSEASRCKDCHNDKTVLLAKTIQYESSLHYEGGAFATHANAGCAECHTSEGFTERINSNNLTSIKANITDATPVNCRTCHYIHATYGIQDYALRTNKPVKLELTGTVVDMGKGNLCVNCHQPRWTTPIPKAGTAEIEITSSRMGPHYGVQSAIIAGVGSYGTPFMGTSVHYKTVQDGCVTCHMGNAVGNQSGGHTFRTAYTSETGTVTQNLASCKTCHKDITKFDRNNVVTDVTASIAELKKALIAKGILVESTGLAKTGKYPAKLVGAYWNYKMVTEDRSNGIHNPQFVKAILKSSIEDAK